LSTPPPTKRVTGYGAVFGAFNTICPSTPSFRSIYDFFRVHFVFHVGVSGSNSFGFLSVSPTVFKLSFKIQTGKNKTKKVGFQFHVGILWRFTSLKGFISSFFCVSVGFHVGFHLGILSDFLSGLISSVM
jgi:hypothetical protein